MIRKALIPIAGLGRRLAPLTSAVPKGLLPLIDSRKRLLPVVHYIIEEAISCGIKSIGLIVSSGHVDMLRRYFTAARKHSASAFDAEIDYIVQPAPVGFGEAVARGADFVGDEPFMLLLGDHVYLPQPEMPSCASQVASAFDAQGGSAMIGMQIVTADELSRVGVAAGEKIGDRLYRCIDLVEKPEVETARRRLITADLGDGEFLAHAGIYIFTPEIFEILSRLAAADRPAGEEVQLSDAQVILLRRHPQSYFLYLIAGESLDTGTPEAYEQALKRAVRL